MRLKTLILLLALLVPSVGRSYQVFDHWVGAHVAAVSNSTTTFTMSISNDVVTAVFRTTNSPFNNIRLAVSQTPTVGSHPLALSRTSVYGTNADLVVANANTYTMTVLTNQGGQYTLSGTLVLTNAGFAGGVPLAVVSGPFRFTNVTDIACSLYGANQIAILTNNLAGSFQMAYRIAVGRQPNSIAVGDLNGDGYPDLVCANGADNTITVLTNTGTGIFIQASLYAVDQDPVQVQLANLNQGTSLDIITVNELGNSVSVLINDGTGNFPLSISYPVGLHPTSATVGDILGNGLLDIVTANVGTNTLTVLTNDSTGSFQTMQTVTVNPAPVSVVWVPGTQPMLVYSARTNFIGILNDRSAVLAVAPSITTSNNPGALLVTDVNGDGALDVIATIPGNQTIVVLTNVPSAFTPIAVNYVVSSPKSLPVTVNLFASDSDPYNSGLWVSSFSAASGTATLLVSNLTLVPVTNYIGSDVINYSITNGLSGAASATVTVVYTNRPPVANSPLVNMTENTTLVVPVANLGSDPDGDALTLAAVSATNGTAVITTNCLVYTPTNNYIGMSSVQYTITDGYGGTNSNVLAVSVAASYLPPYAVSQTFYGPKSITYTLPVLAPDYDPNLLTFGLKATSATNNGLATIVGTNVVFVPNTNFIGTASFIYSITNTVPLTNAALVSLVLTDQPPQVVNLSYIVATNTPLLINILTNCTDADGDYLSLTAVTQTNCTASISGTNISITTGGYDPQSVGYGVTDGFVTNYGVISLVAGTNAIPTLTANNAPAGYLASSSSDYDSIGDGPYHAFIPATFWIPGSGQAWVQIQLPATVRAVGYTVNIGVGSGFNSIQFLSSTNGTTWVTNNTTAFNLSFNSAIAATPASANYFRWNFNCSGLPTVSYIQLLAY